MKYYPYLRAKQFELKALRELCEEYSDAVSDQLIPIIEPVNKEDRALTIAVETFLQRGMKFALIVNPTTGDFKHHTIPFELPEADGLREAFDCWIPAYIVTNNAQKVMSLVETEDYDNVMLVFPKGIDMAIPMMQDLLSLPKIRYVVCDFGNTSRSVRGHLQNSDKIVICMDDNFNEQQKNADYAGMVDELFTENVFYYEEDQYDGYSDYTALPSNMPEGGMLPYAIAIHMTYKRTADQIYIHHFVSDSNDNNRDTAKKFAEAGLKVIDFYQGRKEMTPSAQELVERSRIANSSKQGATIEGGYPGLGYLKKLSIKNHIELLLNLR